ncbi:MAG: hypothetical protein U0670_06485 [Anaerolineae bacterium]
MGRWSSLFLPYADPSLSVGQIVVDRLKDGLLAMGYELYNPFAVGPGKAYANAVKLFVCAGDGQWVGVVAAPEPLSIMAELGLAQTNLAYDPFPFCLCLALDDMPSGETTGLIEVYVNGEKSDPIPLLANYLKPGKTVNDIAAALKLCASSSDESAAPPPSAQPSARSSDAVFEVLPDNIKSMAGQINPNQAKGLVSRLSQNLMGKLGGAPPGTGDLLRGTAPAWDSPAGRGLVALAECITLPHDWLNPDYAAVRDAYALSLRRQMNPKMTLLPGDREALDAVPDALTYQPVYGGKS